MWAWFGVLLALNAACLLLRLAYILAKPRQLHRAGPVKTMIVLGSGGGAGVGAQCGALLARLAPCGWQAAGSALDNPWLRPHAQAGTRQRC